MHDDELEIFSQFEAYFEKANAGKDKLNPDSSYTNCLSFEHRKMLESLLCKGIGKRSAQFIAYIKEHTKDSYAFFHILFWMDIEDYLTDENPDTFALITSKIRKIHQMCFNATGEGRLPHYIIEGSLLRGVYLQGNENIISLFRKWLPLPPTKFFDGHELPKCIADHEEERREYLSTFISNHNDNLSKATEDVVKIQRFIRGKQRYREEVQRIKKQYTNICQAGITDQDSKKIIADANTPYRPKKCSEALSHRIMKAAKSVELFSTIRTLTASQSIDQIFDTAFFANRTLKRQFISFRHAALTLGDRENGDGNAICFGPNMIDEKCFKPDTTEITLDLRKLIEKNRKSPNPCIFFKQKDFGYLVGNIRSVYAKNMEIHFTNSQLHSPLPCTSLELLTSNIGEVKYISELPNCHLIARDLENIHTILTCNFFRFIDTLRHNDGGDNALDQTRHIYNLISELNDQELVSFLSDIGKKMTETCEFNFYGAYRVDFDLILTIKNIGAQLSGISDYQLNLPEFIDELQKGNVQQFTEAEKAMPNVFKSSRFMEYLLSKVDHPTSVEVLQQHCAATSPEAPVHCNQ